MVEITAHFEQGGTSYQIVSTHPDSAEQAAGQIREALDVLFPRLVIDTSLSPKE